MARAKHSARYGRIHAALAIVAVVIGMNLLYVSKPTWGGWGDYLVALLWGLGVHAVGGGQAFGGVQGLRKQFETAAQ